MWREKKTQARKAVSDECVMGAISSPINTIDNASAAFPYSSPHLATQASSHATPRDTAVLSVQAVQFRETNALAGRSFSNTPLAAASATPATPSSTPTAPSRDGETTPQPQTASSPPDPARALYSNQIKAPPIFSVLA
jgi:hypothetical protein